MLNVLVCDDERAWCEIIYTYIKDFFEKMQFRVQIHPFNKLLTILPNNFVLINRSIIINAKYIISFDKSVVKLTKDRFYELPARKGAMLYEQLKILTNQ